MRAAAIVCLLTTGCITQRVVPSPGVPFPIRPVGVQGTGNVVFDTSGQRKASVSVLQNAGEPNEEYVALCTTPCAVTLKPGGYSLRFTDVKDAHLTSTADVTVPPTGKTLVRHALGYERRMPQAIGLAGLTLGGVGLVGAFIGVAAAAGSDSTSKAGTINQGVGAAMLIVGGLMVGGSVFLLHFGRGERQEGATSVTAL